MRYRDLSFTRDVAAMWSSSPGYMPRLTAALRHIEIGVLRTGVQTLWTWQQKFRNRCQSGTAAPLSY